jgi:aryl-alcohol dehydrogenase-like predicted oxidoreductase
MTRTPTSEKLETRNIGSLSVSTVGLGCNNFGWNISEDDAKQVVDAALDAGITLFDTADVYGDTDSEKILGRALGKRREQAIIATKFGMKVDDSRPGGAKPAYIRQSCEDSLRRLKTDVIDLYYLHQPDSSTPMSDILGTLEELRKEGKIREYACSNFTPALIKGADEASQGRGFVAVQNEYSLLHREPEESGILEACQSFKMAFVPYFPLKSGLLTGKYRKEKNAPEGSRLEKSTGKFSGMGDKLLNEKNLDVVERLIEFSESRDRTILELAFSWLLSKPTVASVIAGATKPEQVLANADAAAWKLTADELAEIDAITQECR